jgi:hypothetical protein
MSNRHERSQANRFRGGVPHYHRSNRHDDPEWDEWTGEPIKKRLHNTKEKIIHGLGAVIVGCILLVAVLGAVFFFWDKVLGMVGK